VSSADRSRALVVALSCVLAGGLLLALAPREAAAVRLGGVSLLWWYAVLLGPAVAVGLTVVALAPRRRAGAAAEAARVDGAAHDPIGAVVAWTSPVLLVWLAARVCAGAPEAPLLVLAALVAPLIALAGAPTVERGRGNVVGALAAVVSVGLVLWANVLVAGDLATALGLPRLIGVTGAAVLAVVAAAPALRPRARPVALAGGLTLGLAGIVFALGIAAVTTHATPWKAWTEVASRPALAFTGASRGATEGQRLETSMALTFTESHRVTALTPATYRVTERDGDQLAIREWRLDTGDSLTLRPGDRLAVLEGGHVRFEVGKRVPGTALSGVAWADPPARSDGRRLLPWLGMMGTLLGGAAGLVVPGRRSRPGLVSAAALVLAFALAAACWGVYAAALGSDRGLGGASFAPLFEIGSPAWLPVDLGRRVRSVVIATALGCMLWASARSLRARLDIVFETDERGSAGADRAASLLWTALGGAAALSSVWPADPWQVLLAGFGLACAACVAPALAGGGRRAETVGSVAGALAFVGVALLESRLPASGHALASYPALAAAPLAWTIVAIVRPSRRRRPPVPPQIIRGGSEKSSAVRPVPAGR
jgi:hypothetical protein